MDNAAMNMDAQISLQDPAFNFPNVYLKVELMNHMVILIFNFSRNMGKISLKLFPRKFGLFRGFYK